MGHNLMKISYISKIAAAGAMALSVTIANAATILMPTDGDVNLFALQPNVDLAIFDDADISTINGSNQITSGAALPVIIGSGPLWGGLIDFTGPDSSGVYRALNEGSPASVLQFIQDGTKDNFIVGLSVDGGATWYADIGNTAVTANSVVLTFATGFDTLQVDVRVVPVPAAVWLFGSGLLGLVGVARRRV